MLTVKIGQQTTGENQPEQTQAQREPGKSTIQNQAVNVALINAGKQMLTQGIQQYADLTGNYSMAQAFDTVMSIGADAALLATGPVGWIAVGAKYALNISNSFVQQKKTLREIELMQQRAGYISTQGSRYK